MSGSAAQGLFKCITVYRLNKRIQLSVAPVCPNEALDTVLMTVEFINYDKSVVFFFILTSVTT